MTPFLINIVQKPDLSSLLPFSCSYVPSKVMSRLKAHGVERYWFSLPMFVAYLNVIAVPSGPSINTKYASNPNPAKLVVKRPITFPRFNPVYSVFSLAYSLRAFLNASGIGRCRCIQSKATSEF
jgi:hypothetical protein